MAPEFDAVIVGCGPAGNAAAYRVARAGARVLLLEKEVLPRHNVCGGGLSANQIADLEATINATPCDVVVEGTPIDLTRILKTNEPIAEVTYELEEIETGVIEELVRKVVT